MSAAFDSREQLVLELFVSDIGRSRAFYEAFGFEVLRAEPSFIEMAFEGHRFLLEEWPDVAPAGSEPVANVRVLVEDVDAAWQRAKEIGAAVYVPINDRSYGLRDFTILDPDGFGVRFATPLKPGDYRPGSAD